MIRTTSSQKGTGSTKVLAWTFHVPPSSPYPGSAVLSGKAARGKAAQLKRKGLHPTVLTRKVSGKTVCYQVLVPAQEHGSAMETR